MQKAKSTENRCGSNGSLTINKVSALENIAGLMAFGCNSGAFGAEGTSVLSRCEALLCTSLDLRRF